MLRAALILALAACSDALAIEVIVPEGMAADQVELFVALDTCAIDIDGDDEKDLCLGIGTDVTSLRGSENIFFHADIPPLAADGPGSYVFRLERGDADDFIPVMIAVASAGGEETGVAVLREWHYSDGPLHLRVDLGQQPAPERFGSFDDERTAVRAWRTGDASCVGAERGPEDLVFLVNRFDPDCDGLTDRTAAAPETECDPLAYLGRIPAADPFAPSCVVPTPRSECLLGEAACQDGVGPIDCAETDRCVPEKVCMTCRDPGIPGIPACIENVFKDANTIHVTCNINKQSASGDPGSTTCDQMTQVGEIVVDLEALFGNAAGECQNIRFAPADDPSSLNTDLYPFRLELQTNTADLQDPDGVMSFEVVKPSGKCTFALRWEGPILATPPPGLRVETIMALRIKGNPVPRQILLPMTIGFSDCDLEADAGACQLVGSDPSVLACAK